MKDRRLGLALAFVLGAGIVPVACGQGGVVGGECADGYRDCDGECVAILDDPNNCGACGNVCDDDLVCYTGRCIDEGSILPDGGIEDGRAGSGGSDSGVPGDGGSAASGTGGTGLFDAKEDSTFLPGDGASTGGTGGSGGSGGTGAGGTGGEPTDGGTDSGDVDGCAPPYESVAQCGDCFTRCSGATPVCAPVNGEYECVPLCEPPLVNCGGTCVDLQSDPRNCGRCGNVCPTGLCSGGECVGALVGHEVLLCMSYDQPLKLSTQTTLLANAVFLPFRATVRMLAFTGFVSAGNKARVDTALGHAEELEGRTLERTEVTVPSDVVSMLNVRDYDLFFVYDQPNAPAGTLGPMGNTWALTLSSFARAGGTVVVLSSLEGAGEMPELLTSAGLLDVTSQDSMTTGVLHNRAPADAVGLNVLSPFVALQESCAFATSALPNADTVFVVTDSAPDAGLGRPVVVHRIESP